ncbi:hypothetical protein VB713_18475 [Anabaena cylindrica UHCC 0172]|uniref:hypothetical protein n=1 Tax=Anabaena cylindrica TaxID=1165 RepID=UPI002B1F35C0|nr:hypothetical protein [Anabaena cylindrica]MEA5552934.1 hypothetical protein [Anabaena cylindrica UHCC 0172]
MNLEPKALISIFEEQNILYDVFSGKQQMTVNHIDKLAKFFHVSPAVFLKEV